MISRLLFVAIHFIFEQIDSDREGTPTHVIIGRSLDFMFWLGLWGFVAHQLGAFEIHEVEANGFDVIIAIVAGLLWLLVKGVLFVLVPTVLMCALLSRFASLLPRLVVYGLAATAAAWVYQRAQLQAQAEVARRANEEAMQRVAAEQALEREQAEARARKYDEQHQGDHLKQLMTLAAQAHRRWQDDLQAAGTIGRDDVPPPVLLVTTPVPHVKRVRNTAREPLCVQLVRTQRAATANTYYHCNRDLREQCIDIAPGASVDFALPRDETAYGCDDGYIEYRIGDALRAGPSWWSYSAVRSLERDRPDFRARYQKLSVPEIKTEIQRIEGLLAEPDRAARWRKALTLPAQ